MDGCRLTRTDGDEFRDLLWRKTSDGAILIRGIPPGTYTVTIIEDLTGVADERYFLPLGSVQVEVISNEEVGVTVDWTPPP